MMPRHRASSPDDGGGASALQHQRAEKLKTKSGAPWRTTIVAALFFTLCTVVRRAPVAEALHAGVSTLIDAESSSALRSGAFKSATEQRLKVAVAIMLSNDNVDEYLDGAAVLQHSIRLTNSRHDVRMIAFALLGNVARRRILSNLGFEVMELPLPVNASEIKGKYLRETIDRSGCCGIVELLKLYAWTLNEFDRVFVMDMDTMWMQNLDALMERELEHGQMFFSFDHAMASSGSSVPSLQGGFLLLRPSMRAFERMVAIVKEGDFRPGKGWAGTGIGWSWGGQTMRGLVAYYATIVEPNSAVVLNSCEYDSSATTHECLTSSLSRPSNVKTIHFTGCQKPWECRKGADVVCAGFLRAWWMVRADLERKLGLLVQGRCCMGSSGLCPNKGYKRINLEHARGPIPMSTFPSQSAFVGPIVDVPVDFSEAVSE